MLDPVTHSPSPATPLITADDLQVLAGIARNAPIRYRPSSPLATHKLIAEGAGGFAVIIPLGRRELRRAIVGREPGHDLDDGHNALR